MLLLLDRLLRIRRLLLLQLLLLGCSRMLGMRLLARRQRRLLRRRDAQPHLHRRGARQAGLRLCHVR